jgi:hypothetical protein
MAIVNTPVLVWPFRPESEPSPDGLYPILYDASKQPRQSEAEGNKPNHEDNPHDDTNDCQLCHGSFSTVSVGVGVAVAVAVAVMVAVVVRVPVTVAVSVAVTVSVGLGVFVISGVPVKVAVDEGVIVGVDV